MSCFADGGGDCSALLSQCITILLALGALVIALLKQAAPPRGPKRRTDPDPPAKPPGPNGKP